MTFSFLLNNFSSAKSIQLWSESPSIVIENDLLEKVSYDSDWNTNNTDRTFLGIDMTGKNRETYIRWSMELEIDSLFSLPMSNIATYKAKAHQPLDRHLFEIDQTIYINVGIDST